jgi:hypothetical protein
VRQPEVLQTAGTDAWEELRDGVEAAWTDLQDAAQRATDKFRWPRQRVLPPLPGGAVDFTDHRRYSTGMAHAEPGCCAYH